MTCGRRASTPCGRRARRDVRQTCKHASGLPHVTHRLTACKHAADVQARVSGGIHRDLHVRQQPLHRHGAHGRRQPHQHHTGLSVAGVTRSVYSLPLNAVLSFVYPRLEDSGEPRPPPRLGRRWCIPATQIGSASHGVAAPPRLSPRLGRAAARQRKRCSAQAAMICGLSAVSCNPKDAATSIAWRAVVGTQRCCRADPMHTSGPRHTSRARILGADLEESVGSARRCGRSARTMMRFKMTRWRHVSCGTVVRHRCVPCGTVVRQRCVQQYCKTSAVICLVVRHRFHSWLMEPALHWRGREVEKGREPILCTNPVLGTQKKKKKKKRRSRREIDRSNID